MAEVGAGGRVQGDVLDVALVLSAGMAGLRHGLVVGGRRRTWAGYGDRQAEVETPVHLQPERAVGVDVRPEQGGQAAPVLVRELLRPSWTARQNRAIVPIDPTGCFSSAGSATSTNCPDGAAVVDTTGGATLNKLRYGHPLG